MEKCDQNTEVLLAFGGNLPSKLGTPAATIYAAVDKLVSRGIRPLALSALYRSPAVTLEDSTQAPEYTNAAGLFSTALSPEELLDVTQEVERACGRRAGARWSARTLDIDLLAYGDATLPGGEAWAALEGSDDPAAILAEPVVPHPRLHKRGFVLLPLHDVAPAWRHPVLGRTVAAMLRDAENGGLCAGVEKLAPPPSCQAK